VSKVVSEIPSGLSDVVMRCLARTPEDRFQCAADLAEALAPFEDDAPAKREVAAAEEEPAAPSEDEEEGTSRGWWPAAAAAVVVLGLATAYALWGSRDPPEQASTPTQPSGVAQPPETSVQAPASSDESTAEEDTAPPPPVDKLIPPPPVDDGETGRETPQGAEKREPTETTTVMLKEVGPKSDLREARRYCKRLAEERHRGVGGWKLGNPTVVKKLKGDKSIKRARYWTTAVHKGRAIVISLPAGKSSSISISRKSPRPLCLATTRVPEEPE
jgi:serine/threonine-protein kinase